MFSVPKNLITSSTAVVAQTGHGKSLLVSAVIRDHLLSGRAVATNIEIYYPPDAPPFLLTRLPDVPSAQDMHWLHLGYDGNEIDDKRNGLIVYDECSLLLNARQWQNNTDLVQHLVNLRKHRYFFVAISQSFATLDSTIRAGFSARVIKTFVVSRFFGLHRAKVYDNESGHFNDKVGRVVSESLLSSFLYLRSNSKGFYSTEQSYQVGKRQFDFFDLKHFPPIGNFGFLEKSADGSTFYRVFSPGKVFHAKNWMTLPVDFSFGPSHVLPKQKKKEDKKEDKKEKSGLKKWFFVFLALFLLWFFFSGSDKQQQTVIDSNVAQSSKPVKSCDFFESMGPKTKDLFKDDILVSYLSLYDYDFKISNIFSRFASPGSPGFTVL